MINKTACLSLRRDEIVKYIDDISNRLKKQYAKISPKLYPTKCSNK